MKSLLVGVSMPRDVSNANQLASMNDPLFFRGERGAQVYLKPPTFYRRARNDKRSTGGSLNPNIADRMYTTAAMASGW
jgi:hypothetical protein